MKNGPNPRAVTIYQVAERAGVSIATVSNALNRPGRVGAATRDRVLAIADELGFVPRLQAVSQARKAMGRIGVVAPFSSYSSFYRRLSGVLTEAASRFVEVSVFDVESAATAASPVLAGIPIRGQLDGLIVMGERIEDSIERRLFDRGTPTVVVDAPSGRFSSVGTDDVAGGRLAASYLLELGHRRFGFMIERQAMPYESQALHRLAGFRQTLEELSGRSLLVVSSMATVEAARSAAREMLDRADRPDAVLGYFDDLAIGVLLAARDLGIRVPDELAVMGYDDGPAAAAVGLTSVRQPFEQTGSVAAQILFSALNGPPQRGVTLLDPSLIERESTAPARSG